MYLFNHTPCLNLLISFMPYLTYECLLYFSILQVLLRGRPLMIGGGSEEIEEK